MSLKCQEFRPVPLSQWLTHFAKMPRNSAISYRMAKSAQSNRTEWLGREDSNLRMPVPKTVVNGEFLRVSVRNAEFIHRRNSRG